MSVCPQQPPSRQPWPPSSSPPTLLAPALRAPHRQPERPLKNYGIIAMSHKMCHFNRFYVYNPVALITFSMLCPRHHHGLFPKLCDHPSPSRSPTPAPGNDQSLLNECKVPGWGSQRQVFVTRGPGPTHTARAPLLSGVDSVPLGLPTTP